MSRGCDHFVLEQSSRIFDKLNRVVKIEAVMLVQMM